jgi:hypothetical protein
LAKSAKKSLIFLAKIFAGMKKRSIFALAIKHWFGSSVG